MPVSHSISTQARRSKRISPQRIFFDPSYIIARRSRHFVADKPLAAKLRLIKSVSEREPSDALLRVHFTLLKAATSFDDEEGYPEIDVENTAACESLARYVNLPLHYILRSPEAALRCLHIAILYGLDSEREDDKEETEAGSEIKKRRI